MMPNNEMSKIIFFVLILIIIFLVVFSIFLLTRKRKDQNENLIYADHIEKFENYLHVFLYFCEKSYLMVYKDKILVYSLEANKLDQKELEVVSKDFVSLLKQFLGPNLTNRLISFFGDETAFSVNAIDFFYSKYENDKIRDNSVDEMMNSDILLNQKQSNFER